MASAFSTRDPADPDDTSRNCCFNVIFQWIMQGFEVRRTILKNCVALISDAKAVRQAYPSMIATARVQPAEARSILTGKHDTVNPLEGNSSRLCSFSMWQ